MLQLHELGRSYSSQEGHAAALLGAAQVRGGQTSLHAVTAIPRFAVA